jgi:tRNA threonylcarbamoyl adenosine modification protein YeaZ
MLLALETSTSICSVVFESETGERFEKRFDGRTSHSEKLFLFIKALMEEHQFSLDGLSAVLVSEGPGSYTGLRIAASGVKGLLFGADVPLCGVSTLASFAVEAAGKEPSASTIHAIIDARRQHLYHQKFNLSDGIICAECEVETILIESFEKMLQPKDIIVGTGFGRLDEKLITTVRSYGKSVISARSLVQLFHRKEAANFIHKVDAGAFDPAY